MLWLHFQNLYLVSFYYFSLSPLSLCMEGINGLKMMVKFTWASQNEKKAFLFLNLNLGPVYEHCDNVISLCHSEFRITLCSFIYLSKPQDTAFFFKETILILYLCPIALRKVWINKKCPIYIWLSIITIETITKSG